MVILNEGLNKVRDFLVTEVVEGDWGTGTAASFPTNSGLANELSSVEVSVVGSTNDKAASLVAVMPSTSGGTAVITEHVLRFADGTELNRVVFAGITKSARKEIHNISTVIITNGNT
jgi:hypothetical protein